jgi:hypothetical protein
LTPHKFSYWWAVLIGLVFPVLQAGVYCFRFGRLNPYASPLEYVLFFLAGALGGLVLIAFWRRAETKTTRRAALVGVPAGDALCAGRDAGRRPVRVGRRGVAAGSLLGALHRHRLLDRAAGLLSRSLRR